MGGRGRVGDGGVRESRGWRGERESGGWGGEGEWGMEG